MGSTHGDPPLQLPSALAPELGSGCSRPQLELAAARLQQGAPRGLFIHQTSSGVTSSFLLRIGHGLEVCADVGFNVKK